MKGPKAQLSDDISTHIFSTSATLLGVCITVIGLLRVIVALSKADTYADDIVAADALTFLVSCLLSYWALRTRVERRRPRVERWADAVFILGLTLMAVASILITYTVANF